MNLILQARRPRKTNQKCVKLLRRNSRAAIRNANLHSRALPFCGIDATMQSSCLLACRTSEHCRGDCAEHVSSLLRPRAPLAGPVRFVFNNEFLVFERYTRLLDAAFDQLFDGERHTFLEHPPRCHVAVAEDCSTRAESFSLSL